jgi:phosphoglycolate phosphatase-like HAD superfamily hydrolase
MELHPMLEIVRKAPATHTKVVLFDFDGTLSLIRTGWMGVMVPMMVEILASLRTGETEDQLRAIVEDYVWRLTGLETVFQMIELAEQVRRRGGVPLDPLAYKKIYLDRLWQVIRGRIESLRSGQAPPDRYLVPGARPLIEDLRGRGLRMYLASGTDEVYMKEEADLLDVSRYFDGGVYGALDDYKSFSKRILVQRILSLPGMRGESLRILSLPEVRGYHLLGFGDGYVEIEEVRQVGGVTVGAATDEPECRTPDEWKRQRLIAAGADYIVPNYLCREELFRALFS